MSCTTSSSNRFSKDPDSNLDYGADWTDWLALVPGDAIATSMWEVDPGLTESQTSSFNGATTTVWLSGGTLGAKYNVVNRITTTEGRIEDQTLIFTIKQK